MRLFSVHSLVAAAAAVLWSSGVSHACEPVPSTGFGERTRPFVASAQYFGHTSIIKCTTREGIERERLSLAAIHDSNPLLYGISPSVKDMFVEPFKGVPPVANYCCTVFKHHHGLGLADYVRDLSSKSKDRLLPNIFVQLITAIQYLHRLGWAYGDLTPEHVAIRYTGVRNPPKVILTDLSGAQHVWSREQISSAGTHGYLPPEDYFGKPVNLYKRDSWMLGATLYAAYTGRPPYGFDYFENTTMTRSWTTTYTIWWMRSIVMTGENTFKPIFGSNNGHLMRLMNTLLKCRAEDRPTLGGLDASLIFSLAAKNKPIAFLGQMWSKLVS
ncbi:kinase-like domain-containing protein [Thamnocephalis sphaerospora]|uniref:Kinase-like domain-containing protein n=1 Tax=Thamnocephalis sphaerospora TaxID=78915 RepID=A0A4P9XMC7_9FUNG|nr:kinase-like domain-containing protein [Thamnocephalis sphaerospora]|eukprot:RKP07002.1 kinase-like domain-containing protein [Thamnocephalis sphaerospora]